MLGETTIHHRVTSRHLEAQGREPVTLPEPLASLVRQLLTARRGHAAIGDDGTSAWLFPGGQPGRPISSYRLAERLRGHGIHSGQARSTALFQLATDLPAAVLARMLGIHITVAVAVAWQRASAGDWTAYAADVSRREPTRTLPYPARMNDLPVSIRRATPDDLDAIAGLHTRSRTAYYRGFVPDEILADPARATRRREILARDLRSPDRIVLCAEQGGRLAGFAAMGPCALRDPDPQITSQLGFFFVDPASFRQRIGTRLHQACIQAWQAQPVAAARVWVAEFNQRARAFYTSQGWEPDGHHHPDDPAALGYRLTIPAQAR